MQGMEKDRLSFHDMPESEATGILLDFQVILAVIRKKAMRTNRNVLIVNLAISNLMLAFTVLPFLWLPCFLIFLYSVLPQRDTAYNAYRYTP